MTDPFSSLLQELGSFLGIPLEIDKLHACSISIEPLVIQLQMDPALEKLFLFSKILEIPPGKFREDVFLAALKENGQSQAKAAIFGYVAKTNHLALYQSYPIHILTGERLLGFFGAFYEMALNWHQNLIIGRVSSPPTSPPNFGIKL